ncbi:MAG: DUF348 domain-containing protein [Armatimonadetes bacterium]|nr:DUF348 domain-containing protein [Armatimonadota bacterium]NIM68152.1 DUF348 domain-containing protein [Armatimonadota bacterium]NIM76612.1 DUF348 domain-containing protein [Armatimonadota bacterium]NIO75834.1 DUF348 domain-containing protein [Armatimonadota bacterium]NIT31690.1 DUF348 domain-containing protein [Armatimonadota bacterium]
MISIGIAVVLRPSYSGGGSPETVETVPAPQIQVFADGEYITVSAKDITVAEALREAGILLGPLDRVEPSMKEPARAGMEIRVTRVEMRIVREDVCEPHQRIVLMDEDLRPEQVVEVQKGQDGQIWREVRIWEKDGKETKRDIISEIRVQKKIDAVEMRGVSSLPSRRAVVRRCLTMEATAYDPGPRSCGKFADGRTSIGLKAGKGIVAVDPRVIPLRTPLYVEGYGLAIAGDVGSAIKGMRIDLGFDTYREAIQFGRRKVKVYLLQ